MERRNFIDILSARAGISRDEAERLTDALRDIVASRVSEGDSVALPGFGSFEPKKRLERVSVHPATGRRLLVPPKISLIFRPSAVLKQKVNPTSQE